MRRWYCVVCGDELRYDPWVEDFVDEQRRLSVRPLTWTGTDGVVLEQERHQHVRLVIRIEDARPLAASSLPPIGSVVCSGSLASLLT